MPGPNAVQQSFVIVTRWRMLSSSSVSGFSDAADRGGEAFHMSFSSRQLSHKLAVAVGYFELQLAEYLKLLYLAFMSNTE